MDDLPIGQETQGYRGCPLALVVQENRVAPLAFHTKAHAARRSVNSRVLAFQLGETVEPDTRIRVAGFYIYMVFRDQVEVENEQGTGAA